MGMRVRASVILGASNLLRPKVGGATIGSLPSLYSIVGYVHFLWSHGYSLIYVISSYPVIAPTRFVRAFIHPFIHPSKSSISPPC